MTEKIGFWRSEFTFPSRRCFRKVLYVYSDTQFLGLLGKPGARWLTAKGSKVSLEPNLGKPGTLSVGSEKLSSCRNSLRKFWRKFTFGNLSNYCVFKNKFDPCSQQKFFDWSFVVQGQIRKVWSNLLFLSIRHFLLNRLLHCTCL